MARGGRKRGLAPTEGNAPSAPTTPKPPRGNIGFTLAAALVNELAEEHGVSSKTVRAHLQAALLNVALPTVRSLLQRRAAAIAAQEVEDLEAALEEKRAEAAAKKAAAEAADNGALDPSGKPEA
jgi:hypothetical protein